MALNSLSHISTLLHNGFHTATLPRIPSCIGALPCTILNTFYPYSSLLQSSLQPHFRHLPPRCRASDPKILVWRRWLIAMVLQNFISCTSSLSFFSFSPPFSGLSKSSICFEPSLGLFPLGQSLSFACFYWVHWEAESSTPAQFSRPLALARFGKLVAIDQFVEFLLIFPMHRPTKRPNELGARDPGDTWMVQVENEVWCLDSSVVAAGALVAWGHRAVSERGGLQLSDAADERSDRGRLVFVVLYKSRVKVPESTLNCKKLWMC